MTRVKYETIPIKDNNEPLVDLVDYPFVLEMVYFDRGVSQLASHWLRHGVAEKLVNVQKGLGGKYRLKIWDGWRPRAVQNALYQEFWQKLQTEHPDWNDQQLQNATQQFVTMATDQKRIPPHATGGTVDLSLVDTRGGEVAMGTMFDHFGPEAAPGYFDSRNKQVAMNRKILRDAMLAEGFTADDDEWWHFDYGCQLWAVRSGESIAIYGEAKGDT